MKLFKLFMLFLVATILQGQTTGSTGGGGDVVYEILVNGQWFRVHEFKTVGNSSFVCPSTTIAENLRTLVIGGGGGGGYDYRGGGGAGQHIDINVTNPNSVLPVTVGQRGSPGSQSVTGGNSGGSSFLGTTVAIGGSGGTWNSYGGTSGNGFIGGSGGRNRGGGGGGASQNGGNGGPDWPYIGGAGGYGLSSDITGTLVWRAGGGAGRGYNGNNGATCGGGAPEYQSATPNTGGGGAGNNYGATGVVIVRYQLNPEQSVTENVPTGSNVTKTFSGTNINLQFTSVSTAGNISVNYYPYTSANPPDVNVVSPYHWMLNKRDNISFSGGTIKINVNGVPGIDTAALWDGVQTLDNGVVIFKRTSGLGWSSLSTTLSSDGILSAPIGNSLGEFILCSNFYVPPNIPTHYEDLVFTSTTGIYIGTPTTTADPAFVSLPNTASLNNPTVLPVTSTGTGNLTIAVTSGFWYCMIYYSGTWHWGSPHCLTGPGEFVYSNISYSAMEGVIVLLSHEPPSFDLPANVPSPHGDFSFNSTTGLCLGEPPSLSNPVFTEVPETIDYTNSTILSLYGVGNGNLSVYVPEGVWYAMVYHSGSWHWGTPHYLSGPGTILFTGVNYAAKGEVIVLISSIDPTLPLELSSFTAVLTAEYFVNLTWVTESETQVLGFNVYRSENSNFANAVRVNATSIPATNTSSQATYTMEDREVETNATYYYWLENVDMGNGSALHGPQSVTVTGDPTPVLPEISTLSSAYPNPFRAGQNTNINVSIKTGETGTVTVYNILGQSVKSFQVNEGSHTLKWDGKDCGSGIYFYKLTTPTTNATRKLVIVK